MCWCITPENVHILKLTRASKLHVYFDKIRLQPDPLLGQKLVLQPVLVIEEGSAYINAPGTSNYVCVGHKCNCLSLEVNYR